MWCSDPDSLTTREGVVTNASSWRLCRWTMRRQSTKSDYLRQSVWSDIQAKRPLRKNSAHMGRCSGASSTAMFTSSVSWVGHGHQGRLGHVCNSPWTIQHRLVSVHPADFEPAPDAGPVNDGTKWHWYSRWSLAFVWHSWQSRLVDSRSNPMHSDATLSFLGLTPWQIQ